MQFYKQVGEATVYSSCSWGTQLSHFIISIFTNAILHTGRWNNSIYHIVLYQMQFYKQLGETTLYSWSSEGMQLLIYYIVYSQMQYYK